MINPVIQLDGTTSNSLKDLKDVQNVFYNKLKFKIL